MPTIPSAEWWALTGRRAVEKVVRDCAKQLTFLRRSAAKLADMAEQTHILKVEKDGEDGLLVTFSDGTLAGYVLEELLALRPLRERVEVTAAPGKPAVKA